jgi:hypothetical protein
MKILRQRAEFVWITTFIASLLCTSTFVRAADNLGPLKTISITAAGQQDGEFKLVGRDAAAQLVVTGHYSSGQVRDLTHMVSCQTSPAGIVAVDQTGLVTPLKEGQATIAVQFSGVRASTAVTVSNLVIDLPVSFPNQIVPVFTKFGCSSGGCHGKADGQNGFKLSLLGFEPAEDYEHLVKEARGRRVSAAAPDLSLLLMKASGAMPHGGGVRLEATAPYYRVVRRWIQQGMPYGDVDDSVVERIEVFPKERAIQRGSSQQMAVVAYFADGSLQDVTRMCQFESNQPEMAEVSATGLVSIKELAGTVSIMTRFQTHVDVFRATVPLGAPMGDMPQPRNFVDELVFKQLTALGLPPSQLCDDGTFLRRATIDIAGRLPTIEESEQFLSDKDPAKYDKLIDRLLDSGEHADYFANKWSAVLRNHRASASDDSKPTAAFHAWIRDSLLQNKPYDKFVREVLTATGEEIKTPPAVWYRAVPEPTAQLEDVAQLFLGQRIGCARCHHHPFEKWSQQDYYGLAAFFSRVEVVDPPAPKKKANDKSPVSKPPLTVSHKPGAAKAINTRTGEPVVPTGLGGQPLAIDDKTDPRGELADWLAEPDNPFFARTLANRYWKHFFGHGLVEPEDDLRVTNPPTNPELLDALSQHFIVSKFDMKKLVRTICTSQAYRLSAVPNEFNAGDRQNFSRFIAKRLNAEVLLDAVDDITLSKATFQGAPAGTRAVQLPDNQFSSYFLSVFGRPDSTSACECERSSDANLAQCLHMFNSEEILGKLSDSKGRAARLAADKRPHEEKIRELYLVAFSREPSSDETLAVLQYFANKESDLRGAYEDIIWALINTKEFLFNH